MAHERFDYEINTLGICARINEFYLGDKVIAHTDRYHFEVGCTKENYQDKVLTIVRLDKEDKSLPVLCYQGEYEEYIHDKEKGRINNNPLVWLTLKEIKKVYTKEQAIEKIKELVDKIKSRN